MGHPAGCRRAQAVPGGVFPQGLPVPRIPLRLSAILAAFAAPPPRGERARTCPAQCGDPDRHEQHNDDDNQLNTHPGTSWRAELLRRGVGSVWATIRNGRLAQTRRRSQGETRFNVPRTKPVPERPAPGAPAPAGGVPRPRHGISGCQRWPPDLPGSDAFPGDAGSAALSAFGQPGQGGEYRRRQSQQ
jgi:hypothetical protein